MKTTLYSDCRPQVTIASSDDAPYEAGDQVTCSTDGGSPTYQWSGTNGGNTVSSTSSTVTLLEGEFCLICTVTVNSDSDCSACAFLCDSARGMYRQGAMLSRGEPRNAAINFDGDQILVALYGFCCFTIKQ